MTALYGYSEKGTKSYGEKNAFKNERLSTIAGYRRTTGDLIAPFEYTGTVQIRTYLLDGLNKYYVRR